MVTLTSAQVAALESAVTDFRTNAEAEARRRARQARREIRWRRFEASVRDGLTYSKACVRRLCR